MRLSLVCLTVLLSWTVNLLVCVCFAATSRAVLCDFVPDTSESEIKLLITYDRGQRATVFIDCSSEQIIMLRGNMCSYARAQKETHAFQQQPVCGPDSPDNIWALLRHTEF